MKKIITIALFTLFASTLLAQVPNGGYIPKNDVAKALHYAKFDFIGGNKVKGYIGINGEPLGVVYEYIYTLNGNTLSLSEEGKNGIVELTYDKTNDEIILLDEFFGTEGAVWKNDGTKYDFSKNQSSTVPEKNEDTKSGQSLQGIYVPVNEIAEGLHYSKFDFISGNKVKGYIGIQGQSLGVAYDYNYTLNGTTLSLSEAGQNGSVEFSYDKARDQILLSTGTDGYPAKWGREGKKDCISLSAPSKDYALETAYKGGTYTLRWKSVECATRYIVHWSFFDADRNKKYDGNSGWIDKLEWSYELPDECGSLYIDVYSGDDYKEGKESLHISVDVKPTPIVFVPGTMGCWKASEFDSIINIDLKDIKEELQNIIHGTYDDILLDVINSLIIENINAKINAKNYYLTEVMNNKYYIDPLQNSYVDFFEAIEDTGYKQDSDYFIFGYDTFRDDMRSVSGRNLEEYIKYVLNKTGAKKLRIVAHSQGNLVARTYIELFEGYKKVEKFIMVAPPNKGVDVMDDLYYNGKDPLSKNSPIRELVVKFFTWRSSEVEGGINREKQLFLQVTNKEMAKLLKESGGAVKGMLPKSEVLRDLNSDENVEKLLKIPDIVIMRAKNFSNLQNTVIGHDGDEGVGPNLGEGDGTVAFKSNIIDSENIRYKTFASLEDIHSDLFKNDTNNSLFIEGGYSMRTYFENKNCYTHILYELGLYSPIDSNEKSQLEYYEYNNSSIVTNSNTFVPTSQQQQQKPEDTSNDMPVQNRADISTNSNTANPITTSGNTLTPTDQQQAENTPTQASHEPTSNSLVSSSNPVVQELVTCKTQRQVQRVARQSGLVIGRNTSKGFDYPEKCMIAVFNKNGTLEALLDLGGNTRTDLLSGQTIQNPEQFYNQGNYSIWYMQQKNN